MDVCVCGSDPDVEDSKGPIQKKTKKNKTSESSFIRDGGKFLMRRGGSFNACDWTKQSGVASCVIKVQYLAN